MKKHILILVMVMVSLLSTEAQTPAYHRFEERGFSFGGGYTNLIDTYLSPLRYGGVHAMLMGERFSQIRIPNGRWYGQSLFILHGDYTMPRSGNGLAVGGMMDYSYSQYSVFPLGGDKNGIRLYVGPQAQFRVGGIYNLRNSNNPAQLKLGVNVAASFMTKYAFLLCDVPMNVRLQIDLPLLGVAFGPDYGQSYYEIFYLRRSEGCVHLTSIHNNRTLRTKFSCDMQLRPCTLRFTLANDLYQWTLGNHHYRMFTHSIMLGLVKDLYRVVRDEEACQYIPY